MLLLLLYWLVLLASALSWGVALFRLVDAGSFPERPFDRFLSRVWLGLLAIGSVLLACSLYAPLRFVPTGIIVVGAPLLSCASPLVRAGLRAAFPLRVESVALGVSAIACAFAASGPVLLHDSGLYHYPMVRWLQELGTTPGMALFHHRFGFSSSWLALIAVLDEPVPGHGATALNGLLMVLVVTHFAIVLSRIATRLARAADYFAAGSWPLVLVVVLWQRFHVSASPNFPVAAGIVLCGWMLLQNGCSARMVALLASGGLLAVKLTALPLFAMAVLALPWNRLTARTVTILLLSVLPVLALLAANRVSSGCPLFPASYFCSEDPSALTPEQAAAVEYETRYWARYLDRLPQNAALLAMDWIPRWLSQPQNMIACFALVVGLTGCLLLEGWSWPLVAALAGVLFVFWGAPDVRFGFGYLVAPMGLLTAAFFRRRATAAPRASQLSAPVLACIGAVLLVTDAQVHEHLHRRNSARADDRFGAVRVLLPEPVRKPPERRLNNGILEWNVPDLGDLCFAIDFPCTPYPLGPEIRYCKPERGLAGGLCREAGSEQRGESQP
jgi:hypothetical protein